jgi:NAD(P)-dependent dehydrogenase (short-subunit alcohol dehydrogenase family)
VKLRDLRAPAAAPHNEVMKPMNDDKSQSAEVVLVTGSSSGIGRACCDRLGAGVRRVYGASRKSTVSQRWTYIRMDVTDDASVESAVAEIARREGRIDAVVHCAGASLVGPIEDTTVEEAKQHFDTNFFGAVRVVRAVLPIMRKQGAGKIILVGSIGGLIGLPYQGHYSAGKFALDGLVEALRGEIGPFGIEAAVVHPGDFNTALSVNRTYSVSTDAKSAYYEVFRKSVEFYGAVESGARSPDVVARKVERLLGRRRLPVRALVATPLERIGVWCKVVLPGRSFEYLMRKTYGAEAHRPATRPAGVKAPLRSSLLRLARVRKRDSTA